jgi:putative hydrolase of the HAD superfamily
VERFRRLLASAAPDEVGIARRAVEIARSYREAYERGWRAVPGAHALLTALRTRGVRVAVVTNNLQSEQELKLERCGLAPLVDVLVTSERVGAVKPDPRIFQTALEELRATADAAVMLGDAWPTDIMGARTAGIRAVWFNRLGVGSPDPEVPEVRSLLPTEDVLEKIPGVVLRFT